jgi:hypothetical protein
MKNSLNCFLLRRVDSCGKTVLSLADNLTGKNFQSIGLHQWNCWSWGVPTTRDIIELDRWNIPGEIEKHNTKLKSIAQGIAQTITKILH